MSHISIIVINSIMIIPNTTNKEVLGNWGYKSEHVPEKKTQAKDILKLEAWIQSNLYKTTTLGTNQKRSSWADGCLIKHLHKMTTS